MSPKIELIHGDCLEEIVEKSFHINWKALDAIRLVKEYNYMNTQEEKDFTDAKDIECPFCGETQQIELCEGDTGLVTYWGEDAVEYECIECGKEFIIQEQVSRSWSVSKKI